MSFGPWIDAARSSDFWCVAGSKNQNQRVWVWLIIVDSQFWSQLGSVCVGLLSFCCLTLAFHISTCSFISFFHFFVRVSGNNLMLKIKWYSPETGKHNIFNRQIIYKRAIFHSNRSNCHMILTGCGCALSRRPWGQHCQWCSTPCCAASSPSEPFGKLNATNLLNFGFATLNSFTLELRLPPLWFEMFGLKSGLNFAVNWDAKPQNSMVRSLSIRGTMSC